MATKRARTTIVLTEDEESALRFFFQEKKYESLAQLIRKAMRDGIAVERTKCKVNGQGKYVRFHIKYNDLNNLREP